MRSKYDALQNVCYRLNFEASLQKDRWSTRGRGKNKQSIFHPCDKATVIIKELGKHSPEDLPIVEIMMEAYNEYCGCHGNAFIPFHEFQSWQLDDKYTRYSHKKISYTELLEEIKS